MRPASVDPLGRQWTLLQSIPRHPQTITTAQLAEILHEAGHAAARRTLERDLRELAARFPLQADTRSIPYGWSWQRNAAFDVMPRLTTGQATALKLTQSHCRHLLPLTMFRELAPLFAAADRALVHTGWKQWHQRTAYAQHMLVLKPPPIDARTLANVQHAVACRLQLRAHYRARGQSTPKAMTLHPLGLLVRGPVQYLICTINDYGQARQLPLHRLSSTALSDSKAIDPPGFDFATYASGALPIESRGPIRVHLRFQALAAEHLRDCLLADDQTWTPDEAAGTVDVEATVEDDQQLKWWILGFGAKVEVIAPGHLRSEIAEEAARMVARYATGP